MCWRYAPRSHLSVPFCSALSEVIRTSSAAFGGGKKQNGHREGTPFRCSSFLLSRFTREAERIVVEYRREPALRFLHAPAFARGVVLHLIALDLADSEVMRFGMAEIEPAHRSARPHCEALGQLDADTLAVDQAEQCRLLGVIGLRRITGRRTD